MTPRQESMGILMRLDPLECYFVAIVRQLSPVQRGLIVRCKNRDESGVQFTAAIGHAAELLEARQLMRKVLW